MRGIALILMALSLLALTPVSRGDELASRLAAFGFEADALEDLADGEIVYANLDGTDDRELAVAIAVILPGDLDALQALITDGRFLQRDENVRVVRRIDPDDVDGALAGVGYTAADTDEIEDLLELEAGEDFNFTSEEIATWRRLGRETASLAEVNAALRAMLAARFTAYRDGGVTAVKPYAREDAALVHPGRELARAGVADRVRDASVAAALDAAAAFPTVVPGTEHRFFASRVVVEDRPAFTLAHLLIRRTPGTLAIVERHVYVTHSYNTFHSVRLAVPVDGGVALIARYRTSTDGVPGLGQTMKKKLGRRKMRKALIEHAERVRTELNDR